MYGLPLAGETLPGNALELAFEDSTCQLTGLAKEAGNGRLIVNYPGAHQYTCMEPDSGELKNLHYLSKKVHYNDNNLNEK